MIGGAIVCLGFSASCLSAEGLADRICPDFENMSRTQKAVYEHDLACIATEYLSSRKMSPSSPELPLRSEIRCRQAS
jgi:hypothetical protein